MLLVPQRGQFFQLGLLLRLDLLVLVEVLLVRHKDQRLKQLKNSGDLFIRPQFSFGFELSFA